MNDKEFSERVKKTFGNLLTPVSSHTPKPSSLSNPSWSLTGTEIQKREWRRDQDTTDRDNNPCASSFDDFVTCARNNSRKNLKSYKKELDDDIKDDLGVDDDDDDVDDEKIGGLDDWDLRGSIGLDSTLDNEEEEDAYDKVALGRENAGDRWYMSDIANNNPKFISRDDMSPDSGTRRRDPRANHLAARIRLKEDDAETVRAPPASAEKESVTTAGDGDRVKPILKRKERKGHEPTSKPSKRVTFDPEFVKEGISSLSDKEITGGELLSDNTALGGQSGLNDRVRQVPDYVQNPSKYTRYSLDSTDEMNDKSNTGSRSEPCLDVLDMVKNLQNSGSRSEPSEDALTDLPNSVTFVPKKKTDSGKSDAVHGESTNDGESDLKYPSKKSSLVTGFVDEDIRENEVGDMEVDDPEERADLGVSPGIQGRQYRTKSEADEPE